MNNVQNHKRAYAVFGTMLALPAILTIYILVQLYATLMRF
jgi:hypothetical protein